MSLDITNIKALVKECLSIIQTATGKDNEIELFINAAISDMERIGINIDLSNSLQRAAIINYVKGNFGMTDTSQKELYLQSYKLLITSLQLM